MKLIIGLGNPGKRYEKTRHNVGFMVLDYLHYNLKKEGLSDWSLSKKFNAIISGGTINGEKILLAKPMTFMNHSGQAVQLIAQYYKLSHRDLLVIHDDKDLELGKIKMQSNRGSAGHNGIKSIIEHIGTQDFLRLRLGVAPKNEKKMNKVDKFVLGKFNLLERKIAQKMIEQATSEIIQLFKKQNYF